MLEKTDTGVGWFCKAVSLLQYKLFGPQNTVLTVIKISINLKFYLEDYYAWKMLFPFQKHQTSKYEGYR